MSEEKYSENDAARSRWGAGFWKVALLLCLVFAGANVFLFTLLKTSMKAQKALVTPEQVICAVRDRKNAKLQKLLGLRPDFREQALFAAVEDNQPKTVISLMEATPGVGRDSETARRAMCMAAYYGHREVVKALVAFGVEVEGEGWASRWPLQCACAKGNKKVAEMLIAAGADVNHKEGGYPLTTAAAAGDPLLVEMLLANGARTNVLYGGGTALHTAAECGYWEIASLLCEAGADVNLQSKKRKWTPLHFAASANCHKVILELTGRGAKLNISDRSGMFPLHVAARGAAIDSMKALIRGGADVNDGPHGWTALHSAVATTSEEAVRFLIAQGAEVNAQTTGGTTPLYQAARNERDRIVRILVENGAEVNARDDDGNTALHIAACVGSRAVVEVLLRNGADPRLRNANGKDPAKRAEECHEKGLARWLRSKISKD